MYKTLRQPACRTLERWEQIADRHTDKEEGGFVTDTEALRDDLTMEIIAAEELGILHEVRSTIDMLIPSLNMNIIDADARTEDFLEEQVAADKNSSKTIDGLAAWMNAILSAVGGDAIRLARFEETWNAKWNEHYSALQTQRRRLHLLRQVQTCIWEARSVRKRVGSTLVSAGHFATAWAGQNQRMTTAGH